jgi:hypothetical protein
MAEPPPDPVETPMQRALRLKKAALAARREAPAGSKPRRGSLDPPAGASKPWVKR